MSVSKKRLSRSPSASSLAYERAQKRQKISNSLLNGNGLRNRWENNIINLNSKSISNQETEERNKRLERFYAIANLAKSNDDKSETLRKKTVFQANNNKQRNDVEIKIELEKYMKKIDASKSKIQKDLDARLKKKKLEKLKRIKMSKKKKIKTNDKNTNIDPLDAFMTSLTNNNNNNENQTENTSKKSRMKSERIFSDESKFDEGDLLIEDEFNLYSRSDIESKNKKEIKLIDHSLISYSSIRKNLYVESPEITLMSWSDIDIIRKNILNNCRVVVSNKKYDIKPILKWTQCGLNNIILGQLNKYKYTKPFAVQSQAIPIIMSGRDLICVAQTGSGKTLAYILPLVRHILINKKSGGNDNLYIKSIILCPTRELAQQIYSECNKFMRLLGNISIVSVYGGVSISEQINKLRRGCDIIIGTPGRLIELLCINGGRLLDIKYVSYFVLDEADRLFDLGFQSQITSIIQNVRPDKQLLMFSATFPKKIEKIARQYFIGETKESKNNTIQISIGSSISGPSVNVAQFVYIVENSDEKFKSLLRLLSEWYGRGNILIFVDRRENVDILFSKLCDSGYFSLILHGGINQIDRDYTMIDFKNKVRSILICTGVGSRGLDVTDLKVVINYFPPHHYEDYIHKIGRTGRANTRGVSYTFINRDNLEMELKCVPHIVKGMKKSSYYNEISDELLELYNKYYSQVNSGNEIYFRNNGYLGKGHKFNKFEENIKLKEIERQKYVYGKQEELNEWNLNKINKTNDITHVTSSSKNKKEEIEIIKNPLEILANIRQENENNNQPLTRDLQTLKKALLAAKKKKKEIEKKTKKLNKIANKNKNNNNNNYNEKINLKLNKFQGLNKNELIQKTINRTIEKEKKKHEKQTRDRVETIAKIISMEIDQPNDNNHNNNNNNNNHNKDIHIFKLDINEYPPNARKSITYKPTLNPIKENYNVRITQKGTFIPSGRKIPKGESPLYLEIQGIKIADIHGAIKELKQILHQAAQKASNYNNKYAKYKVV